MLALIKTAFLLLLTAPAVAEIRLEPTLHLNGVVGATTASSFQEIGSHAHDPNSDYSLQVLDIGLNLYVDEWLSGFVNTNIFTDSNRDLDIETEEAFLKIQDLPGGFELRGGLYLNRIGTQSNVHVHGWDYVNADLYTAEFLGEEGLTAEGLELTWSHQSDQSFIAISSSFGKAVTHEHDDEEEDEEDGEHDHGAEAAFLTGDAAIYSADYTYAWRENGIEIGGRELSLGVEAAYRDVQWQHPDNAANRGDVSQAIFSAFARYHFAQNWTSAIRYEHLQGRQAGEEIELGEIEYAFDSEERDRVSLSLTRSFQYGDQDSFLRLQYSHDELPEESADSVFLQFGLNLGPGEVRWTERE